MSETDDTDVLLLIPPNFFLVSTSGSEESLLESSRTVVHKPTSCTAKVLDKLVEQVYTLENRLENLEISTTSLDTISSIGHRRNSDTDSFKCRSLDRKYSTFPRRKRRKNWNKLERNQDLSLTSLDSVNLNNKTVPPLKLKRNLVTPDKKPVSYSYDTQSMDGDISSIVSTPNKKNDKLLLHEIDEFLTKVESYESPETKYKSQDVLSPENVIKATGDYISNKLESINSDEVTLPSGRVVNSNVLDKYIYLVKNNASTLQAAKPSVNIGNIPENISNISHTIEPTPKTSHGNKSVQDTRSPSIRRLNFTESKDVKPTSTPKRTTQTSMCSDTFRPSSNKIYDRASKILEQYKSQSYNSTLRNSMLDTYSPKKDEFKMPQLRPFVSGHKDAIKLSAMQNKFMESIDTELLSLSELWGEREKCDRVDSSKLEEERLKREHCESIIQQLQRKVLEQQEKLAVAVKVDCAKDAAITKLREAWLKLTSSLDKAEERHRAALEKMMKEVDNFRTVADDSQKKTHHFETELYKALDLAHDYQEKCKQLTREKKDLKDTMEKDRGNLDEVVKSKDSEIQMLKENCETIMRLNKQSTDYVKNLEDALEKEKADHDLTKSKVNELNHKLDSRSDEITLLKQERDMLKEKVNEERARYNMIERQLCEKQNQTSELLKKCDSLDCEVKTLRKHLELQKNELKSHYQKQLEDAVMSKLQEFQQQLDVAEKEMENDAKAKEGSMMDTYNKQITKIEEQHKLEISVLEEKQREEINLYRLQLAQAGERIGLLESKLDGFRRRRTELASQLHGVMEAQWRQALRILTNQPQQQHRQLDLSRAHSVSTPIAQDYAPPKIPPLTMPLFGEKALLRSEDRRLPPAPPTDSSLDLEGLSDTELQHYVKLLLTKPPNLEGSGDSAPLPHKELAEEPTSDRPDKQEKKEKKRLSNPNKPPWKS